jgi:hypothetical protein
MREERWQPLVGDALVQSMGLRPEMLFCEVPTRDGSRADLCYLGQRRLIIFELKMSEPGQASAVLDARAGRQLRHYRQAAHQTFLVTVGAPRTLTLSPDGGQVVLDALEAQPLPDGVGWIAFDQLSLSTTLLRPAPERTPELEDLRFVLAHIEDRMSRVQRALRELRAGA